MCVQVCKFLRNIDVIPCILGGSAGEKVQQHRVVIVVISCILGGTAGEEVQQHRAALGKHLHCGSLHAGDRLVQSSGGAEPG